MEENFDEKIVVRKAQVGEELVRKASLKEVDRLVRGEQQRHMVMQFASQVFRELERRANILAVKEAAEEERKTRILETSAMHDKENEEREVNQKLAAEWTEDERHRRVEAGLPTHEPFFERMSWVASEIVRALNQSAALRSADDERQRRISEEIYRRVLSDLESKFIHEKVLHEEKLERIRRVTVDRKLEVMQSIESEAKRQEAAALEETERTRRSASMHDFPFGLTSALKSSLLEQVLSRNSKMETERANEIAREEYRIAELQIEVAREVCDRFTRSMVIESEKMEQAERVAQDKMRNQVLPQVEAAHRWKQLTLEIKAAQEELIKDMDEHLKKRASDPHFSEMLIEIERLGNQRWAQKAIELERERRVLAEKKESALLDLQRKVSQKQIQADIENEKAAANHKRKMELVLDQATYKQRLRAVADLVEAHRNELESEGTSHAVAAEILEEIERLGNQKEALKAADGEKERRVILALHGDVMSDLERRVTQRVVAEDVAMESARFKHSHSFRMILEQAIYSTRGKEASSAFEQERQHRAEQESNKAIDDELLEDIQRLGNRKASLAKMKCEQTRRTQEWRRGEINEALLRALNQRQASADADFEAARAQFHFRSTPVVTDVFREGQRREAVRLMECEREERIREMEKEQISRRENYKLKCLLEELGRFCNQNSVKAATTHEQQERINRNKLEMVVSDLQRELNRLGAINEAEMERARRINLDKTKFVLEELERFHNGVRASAQADEEKARRMRDQDIELNRRKEFLEFCDVLEDVERIHNQKVAARESEFELEMRLVQQRMRKVLSDLVRSQNQRNAGFEMDAEKAMRITENAFGEVISEFHRRLNWQEVDRVANEERLRRVKELIFESDEFKVHSLSSVHEELHRAHSWKESKSAFDDEKERALTIDRGTQVREELLRKASLRKMEEAIELEQRRLQHEERMVRVHQEMHRQRSARDIMQLVELERQERVTNSASQAIRFARYGAKLRPEIQEKAGKLAVERDKRLKKLEESVLSDVRIRKMMNPPIKTGRKVYDVREVRRTEELERIDKRRLERLLADSEQARRLELLINEDFLAELEREKAKTKAFYDIELEKLQRIQEMQAEIDEFESYRDFQKDLVCFLSEEERKRRLYEEEVGVANPLPRPEHMIAFLRGEAERMEFDIVDQADKNSEGWTEISSNLCVSPRVVDLANEARAEKQSMLDFFSEQQRRRILSKSSELENLMERRRNQRLARRTKDFERFRRMQEDTIFNEFDKLDRLASIKRATTMAELERDRRILSDGRSM